MGELGEFGLIRELTSRITPTPAVRIGPGDDAAVVAAPDRRVVASTDLLLEGRHFRRDWSTAYDVGRKAAAQNLADIAAMGAEPTALLLGLVVPAELPATWPTELMDGLHDECQVAGAAVVGGDVVRGDTITVAITALGDLRNREPVTRSGARPGDVVAVTGWLGWSAAGHAVLARGFRSPRAFVEAHRRPEPPYHAGPAAAELGATAMTDVSDGLVADLGHIAEASKVRIDVRSAALDIPAQMSDIGQAVGVDPLQWVLTGGEDHAIVATFPPGTKLPARWRRIGEVLHPSAASRVTVDGAPWTRTGGWDHFGG
ncbi:thiamine-phosphate kinase [Streptomyces macrosporus]|uniref:thiamine-phosphate kinase n=1 Tax=Streptomyces macrosporus TaxID=44032 RepID=UPI0031D29C6C